MAWTRRRSRELDVNGDGVLDDKELAAFVKRAPDLELVVRLGKKDAGQASVELVAGRGPASPLAGKVKMTDGLVLLDLGLNARRSADSEDEEARHDPSADLVRQQYLAQFSAGRRGQQRLP